MADEDKKMLFVKCFRLLKPGGIFINADQAAGSTGALEKIYREYWISFIENSGLETDKIKAAYERMKLDRMAAVGSLKISINLKMFKKQYFIGVISYFITMSYKCN